MTHYFFPFYSGNTYRYDKFGRVNAASKAKQDAETIFARAGYLPIFKRRLISQNIYLEEFLIRSAILRGLTKLRQDDVVIFQWPSRHLHETFLFKRLMALQARLKIQLIIYIHDLEILPEYHGFGIRDVAAYQDTLFIVHNNTMKAHLAAQGIPPEHMSATGIFDYLSADKPTSVHFGNELIIAGSLDSRKTGYIKDLPALSPVNFNLYGPVKDQNLVTADNIHYFGAFPSAQILSALTGSYGLVWDGQSLTAGDGRMANYQKLNAPHKLSLYLSAGFPVILWKEAAMADFVTSHGLGITLSALTELPDVLAQLTEADYQRMQANVSLVSQKLRRGYFLTEALKAIETERS